MIKDYPMNPAPPRHAPQSFPSKHSEMFLRISNRKRQLGLSACEPPSEPPLKMPKVNKVNNNQRNTVEAPARGPPYPVEKPPPPPKNKGPAESSDPIWN